MRRERDADRDSAVAAEKGLAHRKSVNAQVKGLGIHGGRYWDRTSDLFGVNCRRWGWLGSFTHLGRSLRDHCGPLRAPRLLYFAAVRQLPETGGNAGAQTSHGTWHRAE
jgi:hypothetical protein